MPTQRPSVLLVEGDEMDVLAVRRAFRTERMEGELVVARDGMEALDLVRGAQMPSASPAVILLDLNMPRMGGIEFLQALREDGLCRTPARLD